MRLAEPWRGKNNLLTFLSAREGTRLEEWKLSRVARRDTAYCPGEDSRFRWAFFITTSRERSSRTGKASDGYSPAFQNPERQLSIRVVRIAAAVAAIMLWLETLDPFRGR